MAANDNHSPAKMPRLELLLRSSVLKGELEALATAADPHSGAVLQYAARILGLLADASRSKRAV
jgi:hypothetical protein